MPLLASPYPSTDQTDTSTPTPTPTPTLTSPPQRWPSLPAALLSVLNPFASTVYPPNDSTPPELDSPHQPAPVLRPLVSSAASVTHSAPPSSNRSSASIMFAEPETTSMSEDGLRENSVSDSKRSRKTSRPKTRYSICHPVPESKVQQKLHRQPRSLLQLHRLQAHARPLPALEVISSTNFTARLTRAITRVFQAKHGFCANDLVVLKAEKYGTQDDEAEARDVIGLICKASREEHKAGSGGGGGGGGGSKMLIHLASGQRWEAYTTPNGAYECCRTDEHGLKETVRWVPKRNGDGKGVASDGTRKFNFSTISPHTRRHPVIANLQKTGLDIYDSYRMPDDDGDDESRDQTEVWTDDATRQIIALTAIWVALREGWSPNFKYDDKRDSTAGEPPKSPARPVTGGGLASPAGFMSFGSGMVRRASGITRSNRNSLSSVRGDSDVESPVPSRSGSVHVSTAGRSRADSSSTVLVHRAAGNRRKKTEALTHFRPDPLGDTDLHETSREDLTRDSATPRSRAERGTKLRRSPLARGPGTNGVSSHSEGGGEGEGESAGAGEGEGEGAGDTSSSSKQPSRSVTPEDQTNRRTSIITTGKSRAQPHTHPTRSAPPPMLEYATAKKKTTRMTRIKAGRWRRLLFCGERQAD